jgi:hypothetical protein
MLWCGNNPNITDIIKWQQKNVPTDLAVKAFRYHSCWAGLKLGDMLEVSRVFEMQGSPCYMVEIDNFWKIDSHT